MTCSTEGQRRTEGWTTGPWWKHLFGAIALGGAPLMIAVGVIPGVAALVLFGWPPFLPFGLFSLAVMISAFIDADRSG
jgi:hypothetical protein